ncbi:unnamed protein product [Brassica rapa]|uniref:Uncharacterized protein n=2 Tax=Brassica TaxID=3705 RepID=A0A8D9M1N1_BRACM|nr:unnamed protein product [Brassica napus]CAG7894477.1 unnamed protein product [Brassica rapa]
MTHNSEYFFGKSDFTGEECRTTSSTTSSDINSFYYTEQQAQQPPLTADKKYLDSNPPLAIAHDSESEPEFKKHNLEELQTDECNITHKLHTSAKIYDKVKTDLKLVEPFIKFFNTLKK